MLTDKEFRENEPPLTYDNTMRTIFRSCPRKLYWFLRGLDYVSIPPYFTFGKAWQVVLDNWYNPQVETGMSPDQIYTHGEAALEKGREVWEKDGAIGNGINTWENFKALFSYYMATYPFEPFKVIGMEQGWEWPLEGTPYFLGGSLDGYIEWEPYGLLLLENKTAGVYLGDQYIRQYSFSSQITQYIWYLTQLHGEEVFGCLVNMACKRIPKKKVPENLFARDLQKRSPFQLEEFEQDILLVIKDVEREWDRWIWPKTEDIINCVGGIGKASCLFQNLCLAEAKPWELDPFAYEGIGIREGPWEPWKRSRKEEGK